MSSFLNGKKRRGLEGVGVGGGRHHLKSPRRPLRGGSESEGDRKQSALRVVVSEG